MSTYVMPLASEDDGRALWPLMTIRPVLNSSLNVTREISRRFKSSLCERIAVSKTVSRRFSGRDNSITIRTDLGGLGGILSDMRSFELKIHNLSRKVCLYANPPAGYV